MINFHGKSIVLLLLVLVAFLPEGVNGIYGCEIKMGLERLDEEDFDLTIRRQRGKFKKCQKGKLHRYVNMLNEVLVAHGFPPLNKKKKAEFDIGIEDCGGDHWNVNVDADDILQCEKHTRDLQEEEDESFMQVMERGQNKRKLFGCSTCADCWFACESMYINCCGYERRRLGQSVATASQQDRELLTFAKLTELKELKTKIKLDLMNKCVEKNLGCYNCTAPVVELTCPITSEDEPDDEDEE